MILKQLITFPMITSAYAIVPIPTHKNILGLCTIPSNRKPKRANIKKAIQQVHENQTSCFIDAEHKPDTFQDCFWFLFPSADMRMRCGGCIRAPSVILEPPKKTPRILTENEHRRRQLIPASFDSTRCVYQFRTQHSSSSSRLSSLAPWLQPIKSVYARNIISGKGSSIPSS